MKGIYLGAFKADHPGHDLIYQDINGKRDLPGDMLDIDLSLYDYIICTPPCNYWSRANYRRDKSDYSLKTKHLLPTMLKRLCLQSKPFIVENVQNSVLFEKHGLYDLPCFIYFIGGHTYWTNVLLVTDLHQINQNKQNICKSKRQGGLNVHNVIEKFLEIIDS